MKLACDLIFSARFHGAPPDLPAEHV
jgi:hypothetical protein